ncbi:MAG: thymidylate synthase [Bacteroidales bacterium]|nr:thymidylate synthase [Candidatus Scybalousia scybalohippi]
MNIGEQGYLNLLYKLILKAESAEPTLDRTRVGTWNLFHESLRFDLSEGFPILTTKRMGLKSIIGELLWFLSGSTNADELEEKYGCTIWREWKDKNGELGEVYGSFWRFWRNFNSKNVVKIKRASDAYSDWVQPVSDFIPPIECDLNTEEMWAVHCDISGKNRRYTFQTSRGFIGEISRPNWRLLTSVALVDGYAKNVCGVGYLGNIKGDYERTTYNLWRNMIVRCYDKKHPSYKLYGAKGVTVSPIWHSFEMFCKTLHKVKFYDCWKNNHKDFSLDKDFLGSNVYSPSTCMFLPNSLNSALSHDGSCWSIDGKMYATLSEAERSLGKRFDYVVSELRKGKKSCCGFNNDNFYQLKATDEYVYRNEIYFDQLQWLIDEIKINPTSRRLYVTSANPSARYNQALDTCHNYFQVFIENGKLNLYFQMRSTDSFLGLPYNIASYAVLAHMLALETGYEVGELVYSGVVVHLYKNHLEQVKLQTSREPFNFPNLKINKKPFFEYELSDFELVDYEYHPAIKGEVAI